MKISAIQEKKSFNWDDGWGREFNGENEEQEPKSGGQTACTKK